MKPNRAGPVTTYPCRALINVGGKCLRCGDFWAGGLKPDRCDVNLSRQIETLPLEENPVFDKIKAAAVHCLQVGAPGISDSMRETIAINIARRATAR